MSEELSPTAPDALDDLALRHALGALSEAERAEFERCLGCAHSPASSLAASYAEIVATMTAATLPACAPPAPEVKARLFAAIAQGDRPPLAAAPPPAQPGFTVLPGDDESAWLPTPHRGVRLRELSSASPDFSVVMFALEPGAVFPSHEHAGAEDLYILSGDALMDGRLLHAGDFRHWEAGTSHHEMTSPSGCRALLITSRRNYSPPLMRAYALAHRLVAQVKRTVGSSDS
jgi:quercetin dioxygenase-like cupin family protein